MKTTSNFRYRGMKSGRIDSIAVSIVRIQDWRILVGLRAQALVFQRSTPQSIFLQSLVVRLVRCPSSNALNDHWIAVEHIMFQRDRLIENFVSLGCDCGQTSTSSSHCFFAGLLIPSPSVWLRLSHRRTRILAWF